MSEIERLIEINNLHVDYWQQGVWTTVIKGLQLHIDPAETFGLVGESGCGKSTTANAILGYRPRGCRYHQGSIWFEGQDLLRISEGNLQRIRGNKISLVPQDPTTALNPALRVGTQIAETLRVHRYCKNQEEAYQWTIKLLRQVRLPVPEKMFDRYPHQLSGGQQQRVVIAMALSCEPKLIVLDEPTTGLDVTTQAQILDLLIYLRSSFSMALFYITHNLGVVAQICSRIGVMYAGSIVEIAPRREIFLRPKHPYTQGLIASVPRVKTSKHKQKLLLRGLLRRSELPAGCPFAPRCEFAKRRCFEEEQRIVNIEPNHWLACWRYEDLPAFEERLNKRSRNLVPQIHKDKTIQSKSLLTVNKLKAGYERERKGPLKRLPEVIVDDISFDIQLGETFALVGESGSGKTTVARALNGFLPYIAGSLKFNEKSDLTIPVEKRDNELLRSIQFVFQNPDTSLNPRQRVFQIIGRPLQKFFQLSGSILRQRIEGLLDDVKLDSSYYFYFPDELSGGERQRVAIARALAAEPKLLLCDEILSALDVSVQANILQLLSELQVKHSIGFLFISHDLAVVRSIANRVGVMYWGSLCEVGYVEDVFQPPSHPYTSLLLSAIPEPDPNQVMPSAWKDIGLLTEEPKKACPFAARCRLKLGKICEQKPPPWRSATSGHHIRCHIDLEELIRAGVQE